MPPFETIDATAIASFGEGVLGHPLPIFRPGDSEEETVDGILSQSQAEERAPGNVTRLFVASASFLVLPERREVVRVRGVDYSIDDVRGDDIGGIDLVLRKR